MGKATQDLLHEHKALIHVLEILDRMMMPSEVDRQALLRYYGEVVDFLKIFADKCHHGKEENYLFVALEAKGIANEGGPIGVMLHEHSLGRAYIGEMSASVVKNDTEAFESAAIKYRDLLRQHIEKENNVLFVLADQVLDEEEQDALFEKFEEHEENVIGQGVHEKLHARIDAWAKAFGAI